MILYILKRLLSAIPVLLIVSVIAFVIIQLVPGDGASVIAGQDASIEEIEFVRNQMGLNEPWPLRLGGWMTGLLHGDLGYSYMLKRPVASAILERLPVTLSLAFLSIAFASVFGVLIGTLAAVFHRTWIDASVMSLSLVGVSVPNFWFGLVAILVFSVGLGWFPSGGFVPPSESITGWLQSMALPAITLGTGTMGLISRFTRSVMLEQLGQDYVRTAEAKGLLARQVIGKHALKNAMIPILTVIGITFSLTMAGAIVIESVFSLNGLGRLMLHAVTRRDYPVLQGGLVVIAFSFVFINLLVDILYSWLDPRVRYD
ncbi:ABC transporter permease [Pseudoruegeria sp. SK021]|uniref:ABC transporter permease n=1 Tax=Pseudoruegeria sp. SK021 TaxID=1933035 RepID=UPI000A226601|nr:ABC transporter permease [Pseudoruegeria sp. SK021]OSP54011.1 peptide ABC transporter [Pseudoruegeria sp. SK021]